MTDEVRMLLFSLATDLARPGWCWECGYCMGHNDGCRIAQALKLCAETDDRDSILQCDWEGPDGRKCLLGRWHHPMKIGYDGHLPDRPVPVEKPKPAADDLSMIRRDDVGQT